MKATFFVAALAAMAAPALAATGTRDVQDASAPEATPVINARIFVRDVHLDEATDMSATREASNANMFSYAVPCVAAAVGVAAFAAYKVKRTPEAAPSEECHA